MSKPSVTPFYVGSVKNLHLIKKPSANRPGVLRFSYTDDFSVFDYGKMPDSIPGKGAAMATLSGWLFELIERPETWARVTDAALFAGIKHKALVKRLVQSATLKRLRSEGLRTHYRGMLDERNRVVTTDRLTRPSAVMEVAAANIVRPDDMDLGLGRLWNYNAIHSGLDMFLVPLEVVFRFGVPRGSSLLERLAANPAYAAELGLSKTPQPGAALPRPVLELFSKLEPADRFLGTETALNFSGLSNPEFGELLDTALLLALLLARVFNSAGFKLWDGKFEFVKTGGLRLSDAITPDELRLTYRNVQISKEPLRQWYRRYDERFIEAMSEAKRLAKTVDLPLAVLCRERLGVEPRRLDPEFHAAVAAMYAAVSAQVTGLQLFQPEMSLEQVCKLFKRLAVA